MSTEIDPTQVDDRSMAPRIAFVIVIAGFLLSGSVWIQLYRSRSDHSGIVDGFSLSLWCVALLPYVIGWLGVLTTKPKSAEAALL
jgi:hypothetical protein